MVVSCGLRKLGGGGSNYASILTGTATAQFSCIHNSMIFYPMDAKVAVEVLPSKGDYIPNLKKSA